LIFCPECESRAIQIRENNLTITYRCTREVCGKEFYKKND